MARHRQITPTEVELEILHVLWDHQPATVRQVAEVLGQTRPRAYTSVLTMLNVMLEKGLVTRETSSRAHLYRAKRSREKTLGSVVKDLVGRAFQGSPATLIAQILEQSKPSEEELSQIRETIESWQQREKRK